MLVVMILSVRLVSCQTHRIHSGLLMLTLMFLYFTRNEENGCMLALLSTTTLRETMSQQNQLDGCCLNTFTQFRLLMQNQYQCQLFIKH